MKQVTGTIRGGREILEQSLAELEANRDRFDWPGPHFAWQAEDPDVPVCEGLIIGWEVDGDDARVMIVMPDDHAERFAVHVDDDNLRWEPSDG
jgi:hypothetical protein